MAGDSNSNTFRPRLFVDAELSNTAAVAAAADDDDMMMTINGLTLFT